MGPFAVSGGACVYFVEGAGLVKIGVTGSIEDRMRAMVPNSPVPLALVKTTWGDRETERILHEHFAEFRVRGEWFDLPTGWEREVDEVVSRLIARRVEDRLEGRHGR